MSVFEKLNAINVNEHTEKKGGLTYLSWAWAWAEVKKAFPEAFYTIYENEHGWNYFTDGKTCWVKTGVSIEGIEHIEYLPVMDFKNKSILLENVTSTDVNKTIQRSLTKACARHGLGLYIYAGEDLPEGEEKAPKVDAVEEAKAKAQVLGYLNRHEYGQEDVEKICKQYKVESIQQMSYEQLKHFIKYIESKGGKIDE